MAIKMPHAVKPANSEQKAAAFISGAGALRSASATGCRTRGREDDRQYAVRHGAFAAHRYRAKSQGISRTAWLHVAASKALDDVR